MTKSLLPLKMLIVLFPLKIVKDHLKRIKSCNYLAIPFNPYQVLRKQTHYTFFEKKDFTFVFKLKRNKIVPDDDHLKLFLQCYCVNENLNALQTIKTSNLSSLFVFYFSTWLYSHFMEFDFLTRSTLGWSIFGKPANLFKG